MTGITIGSLIVGIAFSWFLIPYKIAPGGLGGISQIGYHIFGIPAGLTMFVLNIPLFIMGVKLIGRQFGFGTLYGIAATSFFTDLFSVKHIYNVGLFREILSKYNEGKAVAEWAMTDNTLLAAIAGSVLLGVGLGIVFRFRGSTGGTDVPAAVMKKYLNTSMTVSYLVIETGIIFIVGIVFREPNLIIWGLFTLFVTSRMVDLVIEGMPYVKGVHIISDKSDEIQRQIIEQLDRGVTVLYGEGGYYGEKKRVLFTAINQRQVTALRDLIKDIDRDAFVIQHDVSDVMGTGFKSRHLDLGDKNF